jgi:hypothetical protein
MFIPVLVTPMITFLSIACYFLIVYALLRIFRTTKRSDVTAERLFRQYSADAED